MKEAAVALVDYFASDLSLATNRAFAANAPVQFNDSEYVIDVAVRRSEGSAEADRRWQVTLEVRHQPGPQTNFPYSFRVVLVGQFTVATWAQTEEERTVRVHGASVLYGMAREIVRALTGRGPYRPVLIPTVSFYEQKLPSESDGTPIAAAAPPQSAPRSAPSEPSKRRGSKAKSPKAES